jgi:hypothetical protein
MKIVNIALGALNKYQKTVLMKKKIKKKKKIKHRNIKGVKHCPYIHITPTDYLSYISHLKNLIELVLKWNNFFCASLVHLIANKNITYKCLGSYHVEYTGSHPITEVKQRRARLVLGWVTAWEYRVF